MRRDLFKGVVLGAAVSAVLMMATTALAGTGVGAVFNLGKTNAVNAQSTLKGQTKPSAKVLQLTNSGSGSGLGVTVAAGKSPIVVNAAAGTAKNLDADKLDGIDGSDLRFIQLSLGSVNLRNGATFESGWGYHAGLRLPDAGLPSIDFGFTVPPTYRSGTPLTVRLVWHAQAPGGSILLRPNYISVTRPGLNYIAGAVVTDGLAPVGSSSLSVPDALHRSGEALYSITSPDGVTPLEPGDAVIVGFFRSAAAAEDSSTADLMISGVSISY